jgi:hypothetical protein
MKRVTVCTSVVVLVAAMLAMSARSATAQDQQAKSGRIRHVVLFKFKDGTTPEQIKSIEDAFRALPSKIPQVARFEWGINESPEGKAEGFTHCYFLTFRDKAGRDAYLPHPAHKAFGKLLGPHLDKVLVVDYVPRD